MHSYRPKADNDALKLIPGLQRAARESLRSAGITTLEQILALSVDELCAFRGIKQITARHLHACSKAFVNREPFWLTDLPDVCQTPGISFDLETDSTNPDYVWSIGWRGLDHRYRIILVVDDLPDREFVLPNGTRVVTSGVVPEAWERFAEEVGDSAPLYHWTGYDSGRLKATAPEYLVEKLLPRMHDLHATFKQVVRLPISSTSLKPVSRYLGYAWPGYDDWMAAWMDFCAWRRHGNQIALERSCMYQRADVEALHLVWEWMNEREKHA